MILVGQYNSPYARRVAISLMVLGIPYEHDTRSVFGDFDSMRKTNPLGRIPSLILDDGEVLIDSAAILDWIDETVGPERALLPPGGAARREALRRIALANGAVDKIGGGVNYERLIRPSRYRWPEWIARCTTQGQGALAALDALDWPDTGDARSGADHDRLRALLCAGHRARPDAAGPVSRARCAGRKARGEAGIQGHQLQRLRGSEGGLSRARRR